MATDTVQETIAEDQAAAAPASGGGIKGLIGGKKGKVAIMVFLVMLVQVAIGYFLLPKPSESSAQSDPTVSHSETDEDVQSDVDVGEVHIDTFNCTSSLGDGGIVHLKFDLGATIATPLATQFDFEVNQEHKLRVRQAVIKVARSATLDDLNDPNLSTIKRLIKDEVNKVLRKSYIQEVVISEFTLMEQ